MLDSARVAVTMSFNPIDILVKVFDELFTFLDLDHKFMTEVPESSLNSTEKVNVLVGVTGDLEGNIMFCYSFDVAKFIASKMMGLQDIGEVDFFAKTALADFHSEFCKRFIHYAKIANMDEVADKEKGYTLLSADPTYISGEAMYGMISKVPAKKLFFKLKGEKFGIAYSLV